MSSSEKQILSKISALDKKIDKIIQEDGLKIYTKIQELNYNVEKKVQDNAEKLVKFSNFKFSLQEIEKKAKKMTEHTVKNPLLFENDDYLKYLQELYETQYETYFFMNGLNYSKINVDDYYKKWNSINKDIAKMTVFLDQYADEKMNLLRKLS